MREEFRRVLESQYVPAGHHEAHLGKLQPDIKEKWLAALRSGEYRQATNALRRLVTPRVEGEPFLGHCCLGVACDVYDPSDWEEPLHPPFADWRYRENTGDLPRLLIDEWGITPAATGVLIHLNDNLKWDFIKIAAFIEEVL